MIRSCTISQPNGSSITIDLGNPGNSGFLIRRIDGLGPTKANVRTIESIYADGGSFGSSRHTQRNLVFDIEFYETPTETIEDLRYKSYKYFPSNTPLTIVINTDTKSGQTVGYVESNEPDVFSSRESAQISIICPDPFFHSFQQVETIFTGYSGGLTFPFENPSLTESLIEFGDVFISSTANVLYEGDVPTGVNIYVKFLGPVVDLVIHNLANGENMALSSTKLVSLLGSGFDIGDELYISTEKGNKYIYLGRGGSLYNILNVLDIVSDWFTIRPGDNPFTYSADSGVDNLLFYITHRIIYGGM